MTANSKERGGCLTIFLLVLIAFTIYSVIGAFGIKQVYADLAAQGLIVDVLIPDWLLPTQITIGVLTLISIYGIITWKKWGVGGLVVMWAVGLVIGAVSIGITPMAILILGIQVLLLAVALRGRWAYFE